MVKISFEEAISQKITKECKYCGEEKTVDHFYKKKSGKYGVDSKCDVCCKEYSKEYHQNNKAEISSYQKSRRQKIHINGATKKYRYIREYNQRYYSQRNKQRQIRRTYDSNFVILERLRSRINSAITGNIKSKPTMCLLGCTLAEFKTHLQQTAVLNRYLYFDVNNYSGLQYHIDHIIPCSLFDLSDETEQKKCFNFTNMQILLAEDNIKKGSKTTK